MDRPPANNSRYTQRNSTKQASQRNGHYSQPDGRQNRPNYEPQQGNSSSNGWRSERRPNEEYFDENRPNGHGQAPYEQHNRPNSHDQYKNRPHNTAHQQYRNDNDRYYGNNDNSKNYVKNELPPRFARQQPNAPKQQNNQNQHFESRRNNRPVSDHYQASHEQPAAEELAHSMNSQLKVSSSNQFNKQNTSNYDNRPSRRNYNGGPHYPNQNNHRNNRYQSRNQYEGPKYEAEKNQAESQREIMDELLRKAKYECIVCCDMIKISEKTWSCSNCYNVFHLKCVQTWARTSNATEVANATAAANNAAGGSSSNTAQTNGNNNRTNRHQKASTIKDWRCPTCQSVQLKFPYAYFCFCSKTKEPEVSNYRVPHSCGEACTRPLKLFNSKGDQTQEDMFPCNHKCTLMCHPGKCAPCTSKIERSCSCSKTKMYMNCVANKSELVCNEICGKLLNCGLHNCTKKCHYGSCDTCENVYDLKCFCGKETKTDLPCSKDVDKFSCEQKCSKLLKCGFHTCTDICHPGECAACPYDPATLKNCPCGQTLISNILTRGKQRLLCIDPIPVCGKICNQRLPCGSETEPHFCKSICHIGPCPPCNLKSILRCECGANSQKFDCKDVTFDRFKCKRRCNKKLSCGRHKCLNECCTEKTHNCKQTCGRKLDCGTHTCTEPCHSFCKSCPNMIWTEVYCNCGVQVLYPPLACGTKRPACDQPCARVHSCPHPPTHHCHDDPVCPPCTEFVPKMCYGGHDVCNTVPCYQTGVSCGRFCKKELPCKIHSCVKVCHPDQCPPCAQRCTKPRLGCEHPCGLPCHQSTAENCPPTKCNEVVKVYCKCKLKCEELPCHAVNDPRKFQCSVDNLMSRYNFNDSVTLNEAKQMAMYNLIHQLDCDDKCAKEKRNKDLAEALGIEGTSAQSDSPVVSAKYTDQLKGEARANPQLILGIHDKLVMLLNNYKKSNIKTMCYNFPPMNRTSREIVHSYAAYFGCKTESVDREPNRSVIVTAVKTSSIPEVSLLQAVNVDVAKLRPKPVVVKAKTSSEENKDKEKAIDYFNFDGQD